MGIYLIADTHFYDDNIIRYENRPFDEVENMNNRIIDNWNKIINENDIVYVVGDFCKEGYEKNILDKLKGIKYLIKGNHDIKSNEYYRKAGFQEVYDYPIIVYGFWIISHEPLYVNSNMPYANIFGHVHNSPLFKTYSSQHYCVSVERINYMPISLENVMVSIKNAGK